MIRILAIALFTIIVFIGLSAALLDARYGGGEAFTDISKTPIWSEDRLKAVAELPYPPGNIAVASDGSVFFTYHPEGRPPYNLVELVDGEPQPLEIQDEISFSTVLSMRIDQEDLLWILDYGNHGMDPPQIAAVDLNTRKVVHQHYFSEDIAGLGSHLNDFQVDPLSGQIYIADASIMGLNPALIIYNPKTKTARRVLEDHESVEPDDFIPQVGDQKMLIFGVFAIRPGVDSIALDRQQEWLYFSPVTDTHMHRVRVADLTNPSLTSEQLENRVERFARKTMSDGITTDNNGNIYLSDLEHFAIHRLTPTGELQTLIKSPQLRWPDGFSFGPDGWLYVTTSSLQHVIMKPDSYIAEKGPYHIFRLKTDAAAAAGH